MTEQTTTEAPAATPAVLEQAPSKTLVPAQAFDMSPKSLDEAMRFSELLANSTIVPKDFIGKPGNILVAVQWGMEIGLKPMQAMQNIAVINGRPSLWGDALLALVLASPVCEYVVEDYNDGTAYCRVKRRGSPEQSRSFSVQDAETAGLKNKPGPWTQYPKRMQQMRARAFALRDVFPDVLKGMPIAEELQDYSGEITHTSRQSPAQAAQSSAAKPTRTKAHDDMTKGLEKVAKDEGFEAFKKAWMLLEAGDRTVIGVAERDRIGNIGIKSDEDYTAAEAERLAREAANG
ncbi:hypothetical protein SAMN05216344_102212 [Polaromonas sp. OV174]|uniref:hypothetical protein n=1 Tax=Polaromonas sp. OV174 TaxID=1855300 RepID=UPI0008E2BA59|nr:hypothetical protein [Polaromonas sp. OV174]SFB74661.1 hypothetical protein SAMN05216344_102212 [Polaromonas sp. OV174]